MLSRRNLLTGAAGAGALAVTGCDAAPAVSFQPYNWASVRAQFALSRDVAHFAAFVLASHPRPVREAIDRHRQGLDADTFGYLGEHEERLNAAVSTSAAGYLGGSADDVAFTDSTTMGLGLLYNGLRLAPGDEVLTTEHDFYPTHEALRLRASRDGTVVRRVRLHDNAATATPGEMTDRLLAGVTPRTRIVAVTWVHSSTGVKLPIRAMADRLAAVNANRPEAERALLCVDGVHGFGAEDTTVAALGCDFFSSGTHKWLFGPRGTGVLWGRPAAWRRFTGIIPPFEGNSFFAWLRGGGVPVGPPGPMATPGGYHSFEHRWALAEAFEFHRTIGRPRIAARVSELATALKAGLAGIRNVRLVTPAAPAVSSGLVCCDITGVDPPTAVSRLRPEGVLASVTPYDPPLLRFGTSIVTDERDVERALRAVRSLV